MVKSLPNWLTRKYFDLWLSFGQVPFPIEDAKRVLRADNAPVLLFKMCSYGWADRLDRGVYRLVHPVVALMDASGFRWRDEVKREDRLAVLELFVARTLEVLGSRLRSIVLFGSMASGRAKEESDIDLLVVASDLPNRYGDRVKMIREMKSSGLLDQLLTHLWKEKELYVNLDILLIDEDEASVMHPFYLDMTEDCVIIFDRNDLMAGKIRDLKEKLQDMGAIRVENPDGSWYWVLTPKPEMAREVEL